MLETDLLDLDPYFIGQEMYDLIVRLYPICRSITGNGVRETLALLQELIPLQLIEIPSGARVFDWEIPLEWNIHDAYILNPDGEKIVDFQQSNLHVVNYSRPIQAKMPLSKLQPHLHTLPDLPLAIPYHTAYYDENWGFCLSHAQWEKLQDGEYAVLIDSSLQPGHLVYGEYLVPGDNNEEILISCYICHPSMCNDNLSGIALVAYLAKYLSQLNLRYSYRFIFIPETIGAIAWLQKNELHLDRIKHGLIATCVGDSGNLTYKKSRQGLAEIDRVVQYVLKTTAAEYRVVDFFPLGSDERQFCSPGFNLPVGSLMRTPYYEYPEYHTSLDDLNFVQGKYLAETFATYLHVFYVLENNAIFLNTSPKGEPQLGRRGLWRLLGASRDLEPEIAISWTLNLSDGKYSLLDIAEKSGVAFRKIRVMAETLLAHQLLSPI